MPASASMAAALSWLAIFVVLRFVVARCGAAETFAIASICGILPGRALVLPADRIARQTRTPSGQSTHGRVHAMTCLAIGKFRSPRVSASRVALVQRFCASDVPGWRWLVLSQERMIFGQLF